MAKKTNVPLKRRRRSELNVKLIAIIAAVLFVVTICIVFAVIGSHKKENNPSVADNQNNETTAEPTTEEETTTKVPTIEVDLMMIGDMLMHEGVVKSGLMDDGTYNFDHLYTNIAKDISSADIKIVNQETILGGSDFAYTGYPTFNSPWALGDAEVKAGFNIILHATNHTLDKGLKGPDKQPAPEIQFSVRPFLLHGAPFYLTVQSLPLLRQHFPHNLLSQQSFLESGRFARRSWRSCNSRIRQPDTQSEPEFLLHFVSSLKVGFPQQWQLSPTVPHQYLSV